MHLYRGKGRDLCRFKARDFHLWMVSVRLVKLGDCSRPSEEEMSDQTEGEFTFS